jgi:signal transduction histidine kinase/CheY-like chemotaxis protein
MLNAKLYEERYYLRLEQEATRREQEANRALSLQLQERDIVITQREKELGIVRSERDQLSSDYQTLQKETTDFLSGAKHDLSAQFDKLLAEISRLSANTNLHNQLQTVANQLDLVTNIFQSMQEKSKNEETRLFFTKYSYTLEKIHEQLIVALSTATSTNPLLQAQTEARVLGMKSYTQNLLMMMRGDAARVDLSTFNEDTYLKKAYMGILHEFSEFVIGLEEYKKAVELNKEQVLTDIEKKIQIEYRENLPEAVKPATYRFYLEGRILNNLVRNSLIHGFKGMETATGKKILLEVTGIIKENDQEYYRILYADNGHGIPVGKEQAIFDGWSSRAHLAAQGEEHGLGGKIIKQYVALSNGRISALSNSHIDFGQGACFEILLPVFKPKQINSIEESSLTPAAQMIERPVTGKAWLGPEHQHLVGTKILILDDEELYQKKASAVFGSEFNIFYATSLQEARKVLSENPDIRLATIDVDLKAETGPDIIPELKEKNIRTIILSSHADNTKSIIEFRKKYGCDRACPKRFDTETENLRRDIILLLSK